MRAVDKAYQAIRNLVLDGDLGVGERLKESDLAVAIGVSRTPVREALRRLSVEGLIEFTSSHRAAVAEWTSEDADDLFRLRAKIEGFAAELAAHRIGTENIKELVRLSEAMEAAGRRRTVDFDQISRMNSQFHKIILDSTGSRRLQILMAGLIEMTIILRTYHRYSPDELLRSFGHHREIIAAFMARDGEWAKSVMNSHILAARASYFSNNPRGATAQNGAKIKRKDGAKTKD